MQPVCEEFFEPLGDALGGEPARLNASVRSYLGEVRRYLLSIHDEGVPASQVNREHAELVDRLVRKLFRVSEDVYHSRFPRLDFRVGILAVGGYGRQELSLASDVDLLILYRGKMNSYVETIAEALTRRLWDARLPLACATRTIQDSLRVGQEDLSTMTSYLDARFLAGDATLAAEFERSVRDRLREQSIEFIQGKLEEQRLRHERFGESPFLLQPNVREGAGGLRDAHTALWIARVAQWEVRRVEHLRLHGFIDGQELADLEQALEFLWRVRNELHREGRKVDRLDFAAQEHLARFLGFVGKEGELPVEEFVRAYYTHARAIQRVSARAIDHACRLVERRAGRPGSSSRALEEGFVLSQGQLEIPHEQLLDQRPVRLLSAFAVAQRNELKLSPRAERLIRSRLHLIDDRFRSDPEAAGVFLAILGGRSRVYRTLTAMNELGVLGAYLPEFGDIVCLWQHDLYHTYTTDAHSLFLIEQLRRLEKGFFAEELPLATELMRESRSREILFLACLLHDIGKGKGGGHSVRGARLVPTVARRMHLGEEEAEEVAFLVRRHLDMSRLAERRDVNDPRLILNLAKLVENRRRLRNLYLLTVADIRSVSREAWGSWKGSLLEALYRNTADWLEAEVSDEAAPRYFLERAIERAAGVERQVVERLAAEGLPTDRISDLLAELPKRYLLLHAPEEIAVHVRTALHYLDSGKIAAIYLLPSAAAGSDSRELLVFAPDRPGLFSLVTGVLAAAGRNILSAGVYTAREGLAMEVYQVSSVGGPAEEEQERANLERRLVEVLEGRLSVEALIASRPPRAAVPARVLPPAVRISNEDSDLYSIVDVTAQDRPGLLYDITRTLAELGLNVVISRASTRASRVNDAFYVTDAGHKILDADRKKEIQEAVLRAVRIDSA